MCVCVCGGAGSRYYSPDTYKLSTFYCPFSSPFIVRGNSTTESTLAVGGRATWFPWVGAIRQEKSRPDKWCCVWLRSFSVCLARHTKNAHYHRTLYLSLIIVGAPQMVTYPWQRLTSHPQTSIGSFSHCRRLHMLCLSLSSVKKYKQRYSSLSICCLFYNKCKLATASEQRVDGGNHYHPLGDGCVCPLWCQRARTEARTQTGTKNTL